MGEEAGAVKKRKLSICGGTVLCKPKNSFPFRNLNRRGGSLPRPPLVSVDSRGSLRPKGRSCHWQAGRFAPPSKKAVWLGQKQAVYLQLRQQRLAKKTILLTVISASSLLEMCFLQPLYQIIFCLTPSPSRPPARKPQSDSGKRRTAESWEAAPEWRRRKSIPIAWRGRP